MNNMYYHYKQGDVVRIEVEFNEPVAIFKNQLYLELVGDSGTKYMATCSGYDVSSNAATYLVNKINCSYTIDNDNEERIRVSTINEIYEQVPVDGAGAYELIDAIKLCYTSNCSDLVNDGGVLKVDGQLYDSYIVDELGTTLSRKVTYNFTSYYHGDPLDNDYKKETEFIHSYDLQAWYSPSSENTYNMKIEGNNIVTTRALLYDEFVLEIFVDGVVGEIKLNDTVFALTGCESNKLCHIVIAKERRLDAYGAEMVDGNGDYIYDLKAYVATNAKNSYNKIDPDGNSYVDYNVSFGEAVRTVANQSAYILNKVSVAKDNVYAVRLYSESIRLSLSASNAAGDNELLEGSLTNTADNYSYRNAFKDPYHKTEVVTENRWDSVTKQGSSSIVYISSYVGDIGVTFDTVAPVVNVRSDVVTVDWDDEAEPTYLFTRGIKDRPGIPIKSLKYREDGTDTKSMIKIYGSNNDGAEKVVGTAKNDYMINKGINKRLIERASNDDSASKYSTDAKNDIQDSMRDGMELVITTRAGLGGLILPNRTAQVIDIVSKINAVFFIVGVNYKKDISGGSMVTITMIPGKTTFDKLWKNQSKTNGSLTGTSKTTTSELVKERW